MNTSVGPDGLFRCHWACESPELLEYHDVEWGYPVHSEIALFEKLSLEGFQAGLSWRTILHKRPHFRTAFHRFDFNEIVHFTERDVERLLQNVGIIRHRGKIEALINNAKCVQKLVQREGSFGSFIWRYEPDAGTLPALPTISRSPESLSLSKELKRQGWKFVGPTTVYAFMQSVGLVNDHKEGCVIRPKVERARREFNESRLQGEVSRTNQRTCEGD